MEYLRGEASSRNGEWAVTISAEVKHDFSSAVKKKLWDWLRGQEIWAPDPNSQLLRTPERHWRTRWGRKRVGKGQWHLPPGLSFPIAQW